MNERMEAIVLIQLSHKVLSLPKSYHFRELLDAIYLHGCAFTLISQLGDHHFRYVIIRVLH